MDTKHLEEHKYRDDSDRHNKKHWENLNDIPQWFNYEKYLEASQLCKKNLEKEREREIKITRNKLEELQQSLSSLPFWNEKNNQDETDDDTNDENETRQTRVCELSEKEFFDRMLEISMNTYKKYWAPHPRVILWQALYETWYGKSWVAKNKNNLFWFRLKNKEKWVFEYIRYASMEEATEAYADKMTNSQYYSKTLKHKDDPKKYITALIKAWYCSTPTSKYIAGIESCLNKYWLSLDDKVEEA